MILFCATEMDIEAFSWQYMFGTLGIETPGSASSCAPHAWSPAELRMLGLLIGDSFIVLFLALLPVPLALADWSSDVIWTLCSPLLGSWLLLGDFLALRGEIRDRKARQSIPNPVIAPVRYATYVVASVMGVVLWLSAWDLLFASGQALYVLGLMVLLSFAAVEFLFFIGLVLKQGKGR